MTSSKNIPSSEGEQATTINSIVVHVIERDYDGYVSKAKGLTVPTGAGYAKGCLFLKADRTSGNNPWYINLGDNATANFVNDFNSATTGDLTITDGDDIILGSTTGTKIGTATNQKLGFYNATPVVQRSAYTQTYSTANKTHEALTAAALTDNTAGTANTTLEALADGTTYANDVAAIRNNFADLAASNNALLVDLTDLKQLVNSVIDDLQALGLVA